MRRDDHDSLGHATTERFTAAWLPESARIKLRVSYGTGFRSPSFLERFGTNAFFLGNPTLRPEHSRGWDTGIDVYLPGHRGTLSATWFDTSYHDLIVYDFMVFPGTTANADQARPRRIAFRRRLMVLKRTI